MRILKFLLGVLIGAAIGFGGVMLVIWLAGDGLPSMRGSSEGVDYGLLALCIGLSFVWFIVAVIIHLILHEAGHLITGLLTGFRFLSFRVFKYTLVKTDEGLRWKRYHIAGTGGQCILELPEDQDTETAPWFWYNAGGVLMNVLLVILSVVMLRTFHPGIVLFSFLIMMVFVGLFMALVNGIPMTMGGVNNDGHNILSLWRHPEDRRFFVRMLQTVGQLSRGRRLHEMPRGWFLDIPIHANSRFLEMNNRIFYMSLLEDMGSLDEAREVAEEIMSISNKLPQLLRMEVGGERVMLELLTTRRPEVIGELWDGALARYTEVNSKYSPIKCAVLYAYHLLHNHNVVEAEKYRQELVNHQHDYTMPGEARTALELTRMAAEQCDADSTPTA